MPEAKGLFYLLAAFLYGHGSMGFERRLKAHEAILQLRYHPVGIL